MAIAWISAAFALLAFSLIAGAIATRESGAWEWPAAGFVGFVLAFRRGLLRNASAGRTPGEAPHRP